jgi:type VI secretion system protein ImpB
MLEPDSQKRIAKTAKGPRVVIGLEVDAAGAIPKTELPFVVGVLGRFSGNVKNVTSFRDRQAHQVDRENFSDRMAEINPRLNLNLGPGKSALNLSFTSMDDFEPQRVAKQMPQTKQLLEDRQDLTDLLSRLHSNGRLSDRLQQALEDFEERRRIQDDLK